MDAAVADNATVEQMWRNIVETMRDVLVGQLKTEAWAPKK